MPRESLKSKRERALIVCERMGEHYPAAQPALDFGGDPFRLTIAVLLSAQTTDAAVNKVTPELWKRYPTIEDLAAADVHDVEEILRSIGFFRVKAANCIKCAQMVLSEYGGEVPHTYEELQKLPGVGRKTANIVMNAGFGIVEGIAVDTHVFRIAHKLKLSNAKDPSKTFLGKRIISRDAETAARIGCAAVAGLQEGGCLSVVKHFPGHGATAADSHNVTPVVKKGLAELRAYELVPFERAVAAGADGVMMAHILYPEVDPDNIASLSEIFLTDILRGEMGFEGLILADDFRMNGLRSQASLEQAAVRFILAGGDLVLCGANHDYQRAILKGLTEAVENGTISEERLNESVVRVLTAKMKVSDWTP